MATKSAALAPIVFSEEHREFIRKEILKEIKNFFKHKKRLTIFHEHIKFYHYKEINCLEFILGSKIKELDELRNIVNKKIKPYFIFYLRCTKNYKRFRNDFNKIQKRVSEDRRDYDFEAYKMCMPIHPFYPDTYEEYLSEIDDRAYLKTWNYFVVDCLTVDKERALSFFKPSLLTKIKEFIN